MSKIEEDMNDFRKDIEVLEDIWDHLAYEPYVVLEKGTKIKSYVFDIKFGDKEMVIIVKNYLRPHIDGWVVKKNQIKVLEE